MNKKKIALMFYMLLFSVYFLSAQKAKDFEVKSPNDNITLRVSTLGKLKWSVSLKGQQLITSSSISLQLQDGEVLGDQPKVIASRIEKINTVVVAVNYKKASIPDEYQQLTLDCKADFSVVFRVYNDAVAYRFI